MDKKVNSRISELKKKAFATHLLACGRTPEQVKKATARYASLDAKRESNIHGFIGAIRGTPVGA